MSIRIFITFFLQIYILRVSFVSSNSEHILPVNFYQVVHGMHRYQHLYKPHNYSSKHLDAIVEIFTLNSKFHELIKSPDAIHANFKKLSQRNLTKECVNQVEYFIQGLIKRQLWAFKVIDSYGKIPSGIVNGDFNWLGEFNECRNITDGNFTGKYVLLAKPFEAMFSNPANGISIKYGACVPDRCSKEDIATVVNTFSSTLMKKLNQEPLDTSNIIEPTEKPLDNPAIITLSVIGVFLFIVLIGTIYDLYKRFKHYLLCRNIESSTEELLPDDVEIASENQEADTQIDEVDIKPCFDEKVEDLYFKYLREEPMLFQMLVGLSVFTNTKKIFKISKDNADLKCIHAVRVMSLCWVILGHTYAFVLFYSDNISILFDFIKKFSFLIVSNAFFSVDSFFLISGMLTCYIFMKATENEQVSVRLMMKYYFHRFWRLSPPYFICILISANLSPYFAVGPLYPIDGLEINKCRDTWFWNILYINNFIGPEKMCFAISWYLANDMQFFWIAPLILIPFALKKPIIGFGVLILMLVANLVFIMVLLIEQPGTELAQFGPKFIEFFKTIYTKPWCRIGPYLVGIALGYTIFIYKKGEMSFKLPKKINILLWTLALSLTSISVFVLYPDVSGNPFSRATHIFYQTFIRLFWSLALAYIIFACITSNGKVANRILSWQIWTPLSRLSYSTFLVHTMLIMFMYASEEHLIHIQSLNMIYIFIANVVISYLLGYLLCVFIELPLLSIEKFILKR